MVQLEMGTFEQEIIPQRLKCVTKEARELEAQLYRNFLNRELFDDDRVVPDFFPLSYDAWFRLFDIEVKVENAQLDGHQSLGHHFIPSLEDLESDYEERKNQALCVRSGSGKDGKEEAVCRGNDRGYSPGENQNGLSVQRSHTDAGTYHEHGNR